MTVTVKLQRDVPTLGRSGQLVTVSQAYARNYLLPKGLAVIATTTVIAAAQRSTAAAAAAKRQKTAAISGLVEKLTNSTVTIPVNANPNGTLFAAIKTPALFSALRNQLGFDLPSTARLDPAQLKTIGSHAVTLMIGSEKIVFTIVLTYGKES